MKTTTTTNPLFVALKARTKLKTIIVIIRARNIGEHIRTLTCVCVCVFFVFVFFLIFFFELYTHREHCVHYQLLLSSIIFI